MILLGPSLVAPHGRAGLVAPLAGSAAFSSRTREAKVTPDDLLKKAIRAHAMEREKEKMKEFVNDSTQAERRQVLKNDRQAQTYFERAQVEVGSELGGRFRHLAPASVAGVPQYPQQPPNSPFHHDPTGPEPPLGIDVNSMTGAGQPDPVLEEAQQARLVKQLAEQERKR
jgi:hypothetical protein